MENSKSTLPNYDNIYRGTECIFDSNIIPLDSIHIVNYVIKPFIIENSISIKNNFDKSDTEQTDNKK